MFTTPTGTRPGAALNMLTNQSRIITTRLLARIGTLGTQQIPNIEMADLRNAAAMRNETPPRPVNRTPPNVATTSFINRGFIDDGGAHVFSNPLYQQPADAPPPPVFQTNS